MKSKTTAALLAFFLGAFGAQFFYLGKVGRGILCLLFFWTFIPTLVAIIDFIRFLIMSDADFDRRYNGVVTVAPSPITVNVNPASNMQTMDELEKLYALKEKGILTEEEFNTRKRRILQNA